MVYWLEDEQISTRIEPILDVTGVMKASAVVDTGGLHVSNGQSSTATCAAVCKQNDWLEALKAHVKKLVKDRGKIECSLNF